MNAITKNLQKTDDGWKSLAADATNPGEEDELAVVDGVKQIIQTMPVIYSPLDASRADEESKYTDLDSREQSMKGRQSMDIDNLM